MELAGLEPATSWVLQAAQLLNVAVLQGSWWNGQRAGVPKTTRILRASRDFRHVAASAWQKSTAIETG